MKRTEQDWDTEDLALKLGGNPQPCPACSRRGFYAPRLAPPARKYFACKFCGYWQDVGCEPHTIIRYECRQKDHCAADWKDPREAWACPICGREYSPEEAVPWPVDLPDHPWQGFPINGSQEVFRQHLLSLGKRPRPFGII